MVDDVELSAERKNRYRTKLDTLEERLEDMETWLQDSDAALQENKERRLALYKAFQEAVEAVTDVCAMYLSDTGRGIGDDSENLQTAAGRLFAEDMVRLLVAANGLRNRVTHDSGADGCVEPVSRGGGNMDSGQVEEDFAFLKEDERVGAVLLFGSQVTGRVHERSDIDICIVAPGADPMDVMSDVWMNIGTAADDYDVHTFEEFSLKMKHAVMEAHEVVWCRDEFRLQEYFYTYRKLWNDQAVARGVV